MKQFLFIGLLISTLLSSLSAQTFQHDFDKSIALAAANDQYVLMVFSGSDWCKPCIQFKESILTSTEFSQFSAENIVVLEVDFPYRKKNRLSKEQTAHNEQLAEKYNKDGVFPKVLLLDNQQQIVGQLEYEKNMSPVDFINQITTKTKSL